MKVFREFHAMGLDILRARPYILVMSNTVKLIALIRSTLTAFESGDRDEMVKAKFIAHRHGYSWLDDIIKAALKGDVDGASRLKKELSDRKKAAISNINYQLENYDRWVDAAIKAGNHGEANLLKAQAKLLNSEAVAIEAA